MTTGAEIAGAIKSLSAVVGLGKTVADIAKKIDNSELIRAIADLNLEMANANLRMAELTSQLTEFKEENIQLKRTIRELQEASKEENQLILESDLYYKQNDEGPFCPHCYNKDKSRSLLQKSYRFGTYDYKCHICEYKTEPSTKEFHLSKV
jgi:uncharacterized protein involved in exopolysaccharide biosynthesis